MKVNFIPDTVLQSQKSCLLVTSTKFVFSTVFIELWSTEGYGFTFNFTLNLKNKREDNGNNILRRILHFQPRKKFSTSNDELIFKKSFHCYTRAFGDIFYWVFPSRRKHEDEIHRRSSWEGHSCDQGKLGRHMLQFFGEIIVESAWEIEYER